MYLLVQVLAQHCSLDMYLLDSFFCIKIIPHQSNNRLNNIFIKHPEIHPLQQNIA